MLNLLRTKDKKWILQKNVSSNIIIESYLDVLSNTQAEIDYSHIKERLRIENVYRGRSNQGSISTMGVRFSQMCFYMFGYKVDNYFMPSPMTENLLKKDPGISQESNALVNLFSMQYPHPYSNTDAEFNIYLGRLIIRLLLDDRIDKKLFIDEIIWFLPFIKIVNESIYEELIDSILEFRTLNYFQKVNLFHSVPDYDDVFANVTHEFNYYFLRIFKGFGVLNIVGDENHNDGKLLSFHHGNGDTFRTDAFESRKTYSGFVELSSTVVNDASILCDVFTLFDNPTSMTTQGINSRRDWLTALYETEPLMYLNAINKSFNKTKEISNCINAMIYASKYGSHDGSEFEQSLKPVFELFREMCNVEIIAGAGNTDLLCAMEDGNNDIYKMNVDAKTRRVGLEEINASRLERHLMKHGSRYCIVIAPRFASGVRDDIAGSKVVTIKAEDLGAYCYKECLNSNDGFADFESINQIIMMNLGSDITNNVRLLTTQRYGISV